MSIFRKAVLGAPLCLALLSGLAAAHDLVFPPGEDARFHWAAYEAFAATHDLRGQHLSVDGPWGGIDKQMFESVIAYFEAATGAEVAYAGGDGFEQRLLVGVEAGAPPDVAIIPQPGLAAELARRGHLAPLGAAIGAVMRDDYAAGQSWLDIATFAGPDGAPALYGLFYRVDLKSLVWYVPGNFTDAGYAVPRTFEELQALSDRIVDEGGTPWCIGLGSGPATGWPATDWVEEMMLRLHPPQDYDRWTRGALPFDDPKVIAAIEGFGTIARSAEQVVGGPEGVAATDFRDSPRGLFTLPPRCYMHRQASFIPSFFPAGLKPGRDFDAFYFPAFSAFSGRGQPVLGSGTLATITRDSPAARGFLDFLATPIAHEIWMAQSGFLTPHRGVNHDLYGDPVQERLSEILLGATTFRFDGSDLMPGAIGAGAFWTGMIDYVGGASAKVVAARIRQVWDTLE
ncbi:MAG: ABC transporter substrate-binding protein [Gemmobacter sp.]|jgi:alpha-glucoside transport system substrate-binding protein|nr:ABC transporter substrate-binding protein [Gemmobacter sp.]